MTPTHTAIATTSLGQFDTIQVRTEEPGPGEVSIKVVAVAMIAPDAYATDSGFFVQNYPVILGYSAAGTVVEVGAGVKDLQRGDRVMAFAYQSNKSKALQEYTIQSWTTVAKIPDTLTFEEAATIPDNFVCAFHTIKNGLCLPLPSEFPAVNPPPLANTTILIYGASTTAGVYTIQILHAAGYANIIATASKRNHEYLKSLGATHVLDYNDSSLVDDILTVTGEGKVMFAMDCITTESTVQTLAKVMSPLGTVALLVPMKEGSKVTGLAGGKMYLEIPEEKLPFPKATKVKQVRTFKYQEDEELKNNLMPRILPDLLQKALIMPSRVRLMDKGSLQDRVGGGLDLLRNNQVSGEKVVVKMME